MSRVGLRRPPAPSFGREAAANVPGQITSNRRSRGPVSHGDRPRPELMAIHQFVPYGQSRADSRRAVTSQGGREPANRFESRLNVRRKTERVAMRGNHRALHEREWAYGVAVVEGGAVVAGTGSAPAMPSVLARAVGTNPLTWVPAGSANDAPPSVSTTISSHPPP